MFLIFKKELYVSFIQKNLTELKTRNGDGIRAYNNKSCQKVNKLHVKMIEWDA